jgi:hypothetical protein
MANKEVLPVSAADAVKEVNAAGEADLDARFKDMAAAGGPEPDVNPDSNAAPVAPDDRTPGEKERDEAIEKKAWEIFNLRKTSDPKGAGKETEPSNDDYIAATIEIMNRKDVADTGGPEAAPEPAPVGEKERLLTEMKAKMDEAADLYAKFSGEAYASQGFIKRLVGAHKENDPMIVQFKERWIEAKKNYENAVGKDLKEKFESKKINEKEYREQLIELKLQSLNRKLENDERKIYYQNKKGEERGWLSKKVEKGLGGLVDKWRKLPFTVKFGSAIALGIIGGPASIVGLGALRVIGAVAGGKAMQEKLQSKAVEKRKKDIEEEIRKFEMSVHLADPNELYRMADTSLNSSNDKISSKIVSEANWDAGRKVAGIATGIVLEELSRLGVGKMIFNKVMHHFGFGVVVPDVSGGKGGAAVPEGGGKGGGLHEKGKFWGAAHKIEAGTKLDNPWAVTREMYMNNASGYGYDPNNPDIQRLFNSYSKNGILGRLGIHADNYDQLSEANKLKIWAEHETATSIRNFKILHGGKAIPDLVHDGDSVILNGDHTIELQADSGIKPGYLHHYVPQGAGRAAADNYPGGSGVHESAGKKPAFLEALDNRQRLAQEKFSSAAAASNRAHEALAHSRGELAAARVAESAAISNTQTHQLMDFVQSKIYGQGTSVDWHQSASEFKKRMLGSFLTSDQHSAPSPNVGEQKQFWQIAKVINEKMGSTIGNESVEEWVQRGLAQGRVSPEEIIRTFSRAANA